MLHIVSIENRSQLSQFFAEYKPQEQSWLVPDLRTKFELQHKILDQHGYFLDESVLRASDLWKLLLKRLQPKLRIVNDSFARSVLRSIIELHTETLGIQSSAEATLFAYIDQLAPIIFHPDGKQRLKDWFLDHPEAMNRWEDWHLRAYFCAYILVNEYNIITSDWVTSYLQNFNELERVWTTPLIVDLSGEFKRVEAELIRILARTTEVIIIEPSPSWKSEFRYLLKPYEDLQAQSQSFKSLGAFDRKEKKSEVLRFSGMLAEIKYAVSKLREWLNGGVEMSSISIIAPDIESYWPVLEVVMSEEGLPTQKDLTHKFQSLPAVVKWLAQLRSMSGSLSSTDLEIAFFEKKEASEIRYEEFKALYKSLYGSEDISRNAFVHKVFHEQVNLSGFVERDVFILKALSYWNGKNREPVQIILREILQNATQTTKLPWKDWLSYLEAIVSTKEFTVSKGDNRGVLVTKLMSGHSAKSSHRIFLGLSDEALKSKSKTQLSGQDYFDLAKDIGFYLDNPDQSNLEFELRLSSEVDSIHDIFCFGATDLMGTLCSPSTFWMNISDSENHETLTVPQTTRWDELQFSKCQRESLAGRHQLVEKRIQEDMGKSQLDNIKIDSLPRVSASSIETYLKCPFVFAIQKFFKLKDFPDIDLDIDHRTRGQLAHALFEKLTEETREQRMRFDWTHEELDGLLENIKLEKKFIFADSRLWSPLKKKHIQIGLRFLEFEREWRQQYQQVLTVGREKRFDFYLDSQSGAVTKQAVPGAFRISGQIDRVDADGEGNYILVDYKSSGGSLNAHGSWLEKQELQLLFYMWVIEKSLVEDVNGQVIGLFYFILKNFEHKGFILADYVGQSYPEFKRKEKAATVELKEKYLTEFSKILTQTLDLIRQGRVNPQPADETTCHTCEWRRQCRAPHLN